VSSWAALWGMSWNGETFPKMKLELTPSDHHEAYEWVKRRAWRARHSDGLVGLVGVRIQERVRQYGSSHLTKRITR